MQIAKIENVTFGYSDAKFTIKEILSGANARIKDKTMQLRLDLESHGQSVETSMELGTHLKIQEALTDWEGVTGEDGKDLKCDKVGKKMFCDNLPQDVFDDFSKTFFAEYKKMEVALKKQREKAGKN